MSDRLAVMSAGRIEQVGTPAEIYAGPATRFVAEFTGDVNHFDARVTALAEGAAVVATVAGLEMRVPVSEARLAVGQRLSVMLRPERVRLHAEGGELANRYEGVVERVTYLGALTNYRVRCGEARLLAQTQTLADGAFQVGDRVVVEWGERDCAVRL
jgi:ABC-type Fe3+/spermidine/putrescine transport system ATPase subunit